MPKWIFSRPPHECSESEMIFAAMLNAQLGSDWLIRWGYHYNDERQVTREGDFLIMGPTGGVCVCEVKTSLHVSQGTGEWRDLTKNPVDQLLAQHSAVVKWYRERVREEYLPIIQKAIVLPQVEVDRSVNEYKTIRTEYLLDEQDCMDFETAWARLFTGRQFCISNEHKAAFLDIFAPHLKPDVMTRLVSHSDEQILRRTIANQKWLESLAKNEQLLVEGGVGSGKTWMAIRAAKKLAENTGEAEGLKVLVVVYNIALGKFLRSEMKRSAGRRGSIDVYTFEELCEAICATAELNLEELKCLGTLQEYYQRHLLEAVALALSTCPKTQAQWVGAFDALVVDEAQDHNTCLPEPIDGLPLGFWSIYEALLQRGLASKMFITGDPHQRPSFRNDGFFDVDKLRHLLSQEAYVQLRETKRYTQQVARFLKGLRSPGSLALANAVFVDGELSDGPDVLEESVSASQVVNKVESILTMWHKEGLCQCQDVLILYPRSTLSRSELGDIAKLGKHPLQPYIEEWNPSQEPCYRHCSVHKAKGIDSLAVILVGMSKYSDLEEPYDQFTYFMGASRARQLLACVHVVEGGQ